VVKFWCLSGPVCTIRIIFALSHSTIGYFRRSIGISHTIAGRFFTIFGEMTHADKRIGQTSGSGYGSRCIRPSKSKMRIRTPDHVLAFAEFAVSDWSCFTLLSMPQQRKTQSTSLSLQSCHSKQISPSPNCRVLPLGTFYSMIAGSLRIYTDYSYNCTGSV